MSTDATTGRPDPAVPTPAAARPAQPGVTRLVIGIIVALVGLSPLLGGITGLWMYAQRDDDGFYTTAERPFRSDGHAITTTDEISGMGPDVFYGRALIGPVRIAGSSTDPDQDMFIGIGPSDEVAAYLNGVQHSELVDLNVWPFVVDYDERTGGAPATEPTQQHFWRASETGAGPLLLETELPEGNWKAVVMNADGSAPVDAEFSVGATLPVLAWSMLLALVLGGVLVLGGTALIASGLRARRRTRP
jgi:hypothetical protein